MMILCPTAMVALLVTLMSAVAQTEGLQLQAKTPALPATLNTWLRPKLAVFGPGIDLDPPHLRDLLAEPCYGGGGNSAIAIWQYLHISSNAMLTVVGNVVLVPLILFYLLYDRHQMSRCMEDLAPHRWPAKTQALIVDVDRMLSQYLRGQLLVVVVLVASCPIALTLAGFEIALSSGLFTGLAVFTPYVGFATGLALVMLAAVSQFGSLYGTDTVTVVYGLGQILENVFLMPHLIGKRTDLHPLAVIFVLLTLGHLFGFFDVSPVLPISAVLTAASRELHRRYLASELHHT